MQANRQLVALSRRFVAAMDGVMALWPRMALSAHSRPLGQIDFTVWAMILPAVHTEGCLDWAITEAHGQNRTLHCNLPHKS